QACAGYAEHTRDARTALDVNQPAAAVGQLNGLLSVKTAEEVPSSMKGDTALYLLDRPTVLQQIDRYKLSSRDFQIADKQVELLDFSRKAIDQVGRYLFSDDVGPYRAPSYEKLLINTLNMINYLVRGDLQGARVEARRFTVMQRFIGEHEGPE